MNKTFLTKGVILVSFVSFFTDIASEMLYPILPLYLKSIGFSVILIGILEGIAEATAGMSKGYFGFISDRSGKRVPFVRLGYFLSAISKPMMALSIIPLWIFISRTLDRFGKGIRTGARDAILSDESSKENRGKVFGFHRGMDTFGAVLGPSLALLYLYYFPTDYKNLFYIAFIPGLFAVLLTFLLKDKNKPNPDLNRNKIFLRYFKEANRDYKLLVSGLLIFTLVNSSDVFLLLRMKEVGLDEKEVILIYIFYNFVYAALSYPLGVLGDKIGLKYTYSLGLFLFAIVYTMMGFNLNFYIYIFLFFLYGAYAASTEGISKAWISNISEKEPATAIGFYSGLNSICTMIASTLAGFLWVYLGSENMFFFTGISVLSLIVYFLRLKS